MPDFDLINETIGLRVRAMRISKGLSKREVGEAIGTKEHSVTRIENGRSSLSAAQLVSLAKLFGVLVSALIGEIPASEEMEGGAR